MIAVSLGNFSRLYAHGRFCRRVSFDATSYASVDFRYSLQVVPCSVKAFSFGIAPISKRTLDEISVSSRCSCTRAKFDVVTLVQRDAQPHHEMELCPSDPSGDCTTGPIDASPSECPKGLQARKDLFPIAVPVHGLTYARVVRASTRPCRSCYCACMGIRTRGMLEREKWAFKREAPATSRVRKEQSPLLR